MRSILEVFVIMLTLALDPPFILAIIAGATFYKNRLVGAMCGAGIGVILSIIIVSHGGTNLPLYYVLRAVNGALWALLAGTVRLWWRKLHGKEESEQDAPEENMSDEIKQENNGKEPVSNNMHLGEINNKENARLGVIFNLGDTDPKYVEIFAKVYRIMGLVLILSFIIWGLSYDWSYNKSPFEALMYEFDVGSRNDRELFSYIMAGIILVVSFFYRFFIGATIAAIVFKVVDMVLFLFKKI